MKIFNHKIVKLCFSMILLLNIVTFQSCTKLSIDQIDKPASSQEIYNRFFKLPENANNITLKIAEKLRQLNSKEEFLSSFVKNNGYPVWNKVLIKKAETASSSLVGNNSTNADTLVIIPFVLDSSNMVNSYIVAQVNDSISLDLYKSSDYKNFSFSNNGTFTADMAAMQTMLLTKLVFGNRKFIVNDHRLYSNDIEYSNSKPDKIVTLSNDSLSLTSNLYQISSCYISYDWECSQCQGTDPNCPFGGSGTSIMTVPCSGGDGFIWPPIPGGNPSSSGGGGGGNNGVAPVSVDNVPLTQPCDPAIVALQSNTNFGAKLKTLNNLTPGIQVEKGYLINNLSTNSYTALTGVANAQSISLNLNAGQMVDGYMHSHYTGLAPMFSPDDLIFMAKMFLGNNANDPKNLFITLTNPTDGSNYLIKVKDTAKFKIFANNIAGDPFKVEKFKDKYNNNLRTTPQLEERFMIMMRKEKADDAFEIYSGSTPNDNNETHWFRMSLDGSGTNIANYSINKKDCDY